MTSNFSILPIPWDEVLPRLLAYKISQIRPLSEGELAHAQRAVEMWMISLHWFIQKELDNKHKIPASNQLISVLKPRGIMLRRISRLCERCHSFQKYVSDNSVLYADPTHWFQVVFYDLLEHSFITDSFSSKTTVLEAARTDVVQLCLLKNPCNPRFRHLHALLSAGIERSKKSKEFEKDCWKPFCDSLSAYNTARNTKKWQRVVHEGGKAYIHSSGRGKGRRRLEPLHYGCYES